jgi:ABC-type Zn uptake system ZnuABC Zn-binding protein ZnuA
VFANGAGLEEFLAPLIESAGAEDKVVLLSESIELLTPEGKQSHQQEPEGEEQKPKYEGGDPHTWTDPNNVIVWVHNIEHKLTELDPFNTETYETNAKQYEGELRDLDAWIGDKVAQIPPDSRKIVTDHLILAYFVEEYGFTQIGTIIPGYSTIAEPSAQELAKLEDTVREFDVNAIFVGNTVNPSLAERVAEDTGTQLVFIFTGSLTEKGGEADNYLNYIRYNVNAIVNNLK